MLLLGLGLAQTNLPKLIHARRQPLQVESIQRPLQHPAPTPPPPRVRLGEALVRWGNKARAARTTQAIGIA